TTIDEVKRFKQDYPQFNVKSMYCVFERRDVAIGYIRKILCDTVLFRHLKGPNKKTDHIMVSMDADTLGLNPHFIENFSHQFEKYKNVDAISGKLEFDWPTLMRDPVLFFGSRLTYALDSYYSAMDFARGFGGANFAIKASSYAGVKGFERSIRGGEDVNLAA